jgi:hypothetical protein
VRQSRHLSCGISTDVLIERPREGVSRHAFASLAGAGVCVGDGAGWGGFKRRVKLLRWVKRRVSSPTEVLLEALELVDGVGAAVRRGVAVQVELESRF